VPFSHGALGREPHLKQTVRSYVDTSCINSAMPDTVTSQAAEHCHPLASIILQNA